MTVTTDGYGLLLFFGLLTSQLHARVSQGRICSDNFTCRHIEIEVADPTFHLTHSQYTDTGPTSPSADPITPGAWQDNHWNSNLQVTGDLKLELQWLPCQAPGVIGSVLGLVGPESVYCHWMRQNVGTASVPACDVQLSELIRP